MPGSLDEGKETPLERKGRVSGSPTGQASSPVLAEKCVMIGYQDPFFLTAWIDITDIR